MGGGTRAQCKGEPLNDTNVGYKMLVKLGWKRGEGLGLENTGIKSPPANEENVGRRGLGGTSANSVLPIPQADIDKHGLANKKKTLNPKEDNTFCLYNLEEPLSELK